MEGGPKDYAPRPGGVFYNQAGQAFGLDGQPLPMAGEMPPAQAGQPAQQGSTGYGAENNQNAPVFYQGQGHEQQVMQQMGQPMPPAYPSPHMMSADMIQLQGEQQMQQMQMQMHQHYLYQQHAQQMQQMHNQQVMFHQQHAQQQQGGTQPSSQQPGSTPGSTSSGQSAPSNAASDPSWVPPAGAPGAPGAPPNAPLASTAPAAGGKPTRRNNNGQAQAQTQAQPQASASQPPGGDRLRGGMAAPASGVPAALLGVPPTTAGGAASALALDASSSDPLSLLSDPLANGLSLCAASACETAAALGLADAIVNGAGGIGSLPLSDGPVAGPTAVPASLAAANAGGGENMPASGIIFGCTSTTYDECQALSMVGLPRKYLPLVRSIVAGHTLIFLFNFSDRQLHGTYIATSNGQENMSLTAWRGTAPTLKVSVGLGMEQDDGDGSPFPAQCTYAIVEEFAPVPESEFRHILEYTERQRFKFKLSRWQCRDLLETMCTYDAKLRSRRLLTELALS